MPNCDAKEGGEKKIGARRIRRVWRADAVSVSVGECRSFGIELDKVYRCQSMPKFPVR